VDAVARVLAYAGRTAIVQAEVIDAEGQIIACATSTKLVKLK
jgi:acyl-coenzyme A thioesterase PaaI-like protein